LDPCNYLGSLGFEITRLSVQPDGLIRLSDLERAIRADTILVSVMAANNEIGVLQPLTDIGTLCHERGVLFHSDAAQAIGKIPLNVQTMNIDLMSLTAHKAYGPKGIGALYVRRRQPRVKLAPQLHGGGHERGLRAGTLYTPQIVGFAQAVELAISEMDAESKRLTHQRARLWNQLNQLPGISLNGHPSQRLPGNLNISIEGVDAQALLMGLQPTLAISSGSACSSVDRKPSHVLLALGVPEARARASLRFGLGRFNTDVEIDRAGAHTVATIQSLRLTMEGVGWLQPD